MNHYRNYTENQILFERNIYGLKLFIKCVVEIMLNLPLLVAGYLVTIYILGRNNNLWLQLGLTITFAYVDNLIIHFVKGVIISLKFNRSFWWVPLLAIVVFFVCVLPILILLQSDFTWIKAINNTHLIPVVIILGYSIYMYSRYRFLTNVAPRSVYWVYQAGVTASAKLLHFRIPGIVPKIIFGKQ